MKLNLGRYSETRLGQDFEFKFTGDADVLLMLSQDSEDEIRSRFVFKLAEFTLLFLFFFLWSIF